MKSSSIAIVGMAGRFPGAKNVSEFWRNLRDGVESIRPLSDAELIAAGATVEELANPDYVKMAAVLDDVAMFDASFFGLSPRDASIMDPQHRHFLECAWEALEDAGHPPRSFEGAIGVYAGSGMNSYLIHNLLANRRLRESTGFFQLKQTGNDKDVLATRLSYQFDLRGPSINVQTACSTSLVAVHLACQSLLNSECDMALAGGVTIEIPHGRGYVFREGEILSRDGHCRAFDAGSSGTVFGSGLGIVVLRRLEDAVGDHDNIRAVILGSAINNDGARKVGYLAPSVEGQAEVIAEALEFAGVSAADISYVETHGTGTLVGDPIEIRALTQAFRKSSQESGYCGIGSLKTNIGHLDAAAGVAGLIKTVLALEHGQMPASLHYRNRNPHIELKGSPFFVNNQLADWPAHKSPRRAGVTSLGIGGTNAHVVLEEAPRRALSGRTKPYHVLTISAKSEQAVERAGSHLAAHLNRQPELRLGDVAFTTQVGRQPFLHRRALVVADTGEAIEGLLNGDRKSTAGLAAKTAPDVVFLFSGQGSQYANMGREIYENEPIFRQTLDLCAQKLLPQLGLDLREALYPAESQIDKSAELLNQTWLTQPALFALEYSLARWWMSLGVEPRAMVGHSIGEYVAASIAGVFSLEDALAITAFRGRLMYDLPSGAMLAVPLTAEEIHTNGALSLAAVNDPRLCVVSGPTPDIAKLEESLAKQSVSCRRLHTSHAFHSAMMDPILEPFEKRLRNIPLRPPQIPYLSNLSGTWIKAEEAIEPAYWARHLRDTVRFSDCLNELFRHPGRILLEVGPGNALTSLARQHSKDAGTVLQSLPHPREKVPALRFALQTLAKIWVSGGNTNWYTLHEPDFAQRVPLPTYPFEHQKFWIDADVGPQAAIIPVPKHTEDNTDKWFYRRIWKTAPATPSAPDPASCWIVFDDSLRLGDRIASELRGKVRDVIRVEAGSSYRRSWKGEYTIRPGVRGDYDALIADLIKRGNSPAKILHLWSVFPEEPEWPLDETLERSFYSPLYIAQALAGQDMTGVDIGLVTNRLQSVSDEAVRHPARAVLLGPARVIPKELPGIACRSIDVELGDDCAAQIVAEMATVPDDGAVAFRGGERFVETLEHLNLAAAPQRNRLQRGGVYLITGGLGGIGLVLAEHLAREFKARLVLVGRSILPPEDGWEAALEDVQETEANKRKIRKLLEIRSHGGGLLVARGDVTERDQMRGVVQSARGRFGRIDGVFHAAGVLDDGPLMRKTLESASRVLEPKVRGALVLEEVLRDSPLSCFVLFSSISSMVAPAGQVDYAAANAFLDAFALSRRGSVTAIDWGIWREVGMGARIASPHPLLEQRVAESPAEIVYASQLSPQRQWLLSEHRLKSGPALIPGTGYLEMACAALPQGSRGKAVEFEDVFFVAPLLLANSESKEVRVRLTREAQGGRAGAFRFSILAHAGAWTEHATGHIALFASGIPSTVDRSAIAARCDGGEIVFDEQHRTKQERYFEFGPRWRSLKRLHLGQRECLAELELSPGFSGDFPDFRMHPALLDLATGCALYLIDGYQHLDDVYLPLSYKKMCVYGAIPGVLYSHIRARQENKSRGEVAVFDITLFDERGQVLAEVEGFTMRRVGDPSKPPIEIGQANQFESSDQPGIAPLDGARVLTRILRTETPSVLVVAAQRPEGLNTRSSDPPVRTMSPSAPVEEVERTIAGWWRDLLGVEQIGLDHDFFDLGGHSLIGVRLFAKIKKTYRVDLDLAVLFESRTVRQLAGVVRKLKQPAVAEARTRSAIVPIQPKGLRIPLFCVHALGPSLLFYKRLAAYLGPDQPFYALQSPLESQAAPRESSVEELASLYIEELRTFFPKGPYLLGGASFGGLIALEMSRQLYAQGSEPGLLILFDTVVPGSHHRLAARDQISEHWRKFRKQGAAYLGQRMRSKSEYWWALLVRTIRTIRGSCYRLAGQAPPTALRYFQVEEAHRRALGRYTVQSYPGKVTLMRAADVRETVASRRNETLGWQMLAGGGLEIYDVPGDHISMFEEPNVRNLAETLKGILPS
jgi:acyl transferase domain-containing protein